MGNRATFPKWFSEMIRDNQRAKVILERQGYVFVPLGGGFLAYWVTDPKGNKTKVAVGRVTELLEKEA